MAEVAAAKAAVQNARINLEYTRVTAPISGRIGKSLVSEGALVTAQQGTALATIQQVDRLYVDVSQSSNELLQLKRKLADRQGRPGQTAENRGEGRPRRQIRIQRNRSSRIFRCLGRSVDRHRDHPGHHRQPPPGTAAGDVRPRPADLGPAADRHSGAAGSNRPQ